MKNTVNKKNCSFKIADPKQWLCHTTKKNNNKVKKIGSERLPLQKSSFFPATALENSFDVSKDQLGNSKRKV
jgi:hypothetical protein